MSAKRLLAQLIQKVPPLYTFLLHLLNRISARFTVGVTGVVFNHRGEILLLEHVFHSPSPWGLPGGWVRRRERPQDALRRELLEELGLKCGWAPLCWSNWMGRPATWRPDFCARSKGRWTT